MFRLARRTATWEIRWLMRSCWAESVTLAPEPVLALGTVMGVPALFAPSVPNVRPGRRLALVMTPVPICAAVRPWFSRLRTALERSTAACEIRWLISSCCWVSDTCPPPPVFFGIATR